MSSFERLELSFLLHPQKKICASLIGPHGTTVVESHFEESECPEEWISVLIAVAEATRGMNAPYAAATSATSENSQTKSRATAGTETIREAPTSSASSPGPPGRVTRSGHRVLRASGSNDLPSVGPHTPPFSNPEHASAQPIPLQTHLSHTNNARRDNPTTPISPTHGHCGITANLSVVSTRATEPRQQPFGQPLTPVQSADQSPVSLIGESLTSETSASLVTSSAMVKRVQKLDKLLRTIDESPTPERQVFNDTVTRLYNEPYGALSQNLSSMEEIGQRLGQLGNTATVVGVIYNLLSWRIFGWEEDRLIQEEGHPLPTAAKHVRSNSMNEHHSPSRIT